MTEFKYVVVRYDRDADKHFRVATLDTIDEAAALVASLRKGPRDKSVTWAREDMLGDDILPDPSA